VYIPTCILRRVSNHYTFVQDAGWKSETLLDVIFCVETLFPHLCAICSWPQDMSHPQQLASDAPCMPSGPACFHCISQKMLSLCMLAACCRIWCQKDQLANSKYMLSMCILNWLGHSPKTLPKRMFTDHCLNGLIECVCRSSPSAFFLQRDVVGRYASAPDLQALAADSARQAASQPLIPDTKPARAPAPGPAAHRGVGRSVSSSQAGGGLQPWGGSQANGDVGYTAAPMLGHSNGKAHSAYVHKVIQEHERSTAVNRQLRHGLKFLTRNWVLLLVLVMSVGGLWLAAGHRSYARLRL